MALIICSECGNQISDKSSVCIHCGCPIEISVEQNNLIYDMVLVGLKRNSNIVLASTLLIDIYGASKENTWKNLNNPGSILLEGILGQNKDYLKKTVEGENFDLIVDFIPSSMEEPNPLNEKWDRLRKSHEEKQANAPHCPACNSTNIDTISFGRKAVGFATMGIFSKSAKSQFKCNNCGYMF